MDLTSEGRLPEGVHDMDLAEIRQLFGVFRSSDKRQKLYATLVQFVEAARAAHFVQFMIIDGSFVTSKPDPDDIDVILAVDPLFLQKPEFSPADYNMISSRRMRRLFGFDVLVVPSGDPSYDALLEFFSQVKENPAERKGVVRLRP